MALYAVELLLVACSVVDKRFVEPPATFDSGVPSHQVILLILQHTKELVGNQRLQSLNRPRVLKT